MSGENDRKSREGDEGLFDIAGGGSTTGNVYIRKVSYYIPKMLLSSSPFLLQ